MHTTTAEAPRLHRDEPDCGLVVCYWHGMARREARAVANHQAHVAAEHDVVDALGSTWCRTCQRWSTLPLTAVCPSCDGLLDERHRGVRCGAGQ